MPHHMLVPEPSYPTPSTPPHTRPHLCFWTSLYMTETFTCLKSSFYNLQGVVIAVAGRLRTTTTASDSPSLHSLFILTTVISAIDCHKRSLLRCSFVCVYIRWKRGHALGLASRYALKEFYQMESGMLFNMACSFPVRAFIVEDCSMSLFFE